MNTLSGKQGWRRRGSQRLEAELVPELRGGQGRELSRGETPELLKRPSPTPCQLPWLWKRNVLLEKVPVTSQWNRAMSLSCSPRLCQLGVQDHGVTPFLSARDHRGRG